MDLLLTRHHELVSRVKVLPEQIRKWREKTQTEVDMNLHFSQVLAVHQILDTLCEKLRQQIGTLDPGGASEAFSVGLLATSRLLRTAEKFWNYFREKLDLRVSSYKDALWVADTVAWNCYRPVVEAAVAAGALKAEELREPPLTYPEATLSPLTWVRGVRPNDGQSFQLDDGSNALPFAVIELPWEQLENFWTLMAIHHEVGHDLERDLKLGKPLRQALARELETSGVVPERRRIWDAWMSEIFADLVGLQLGGSAFAESLATLIAFPLAMTTKLDSSDPHPTHYLRPLFLAEAISSLLPGPISATLASDAARIRKRWLELYGEVAELSDFPRQFSTVAKALLDTPLPELNNKTVRQLMPYRVEHEDSIRRTAAFLRTGQNQPLQVEPRHVISAARIAISELEPQAADDATLNNLRIRTVAMVRKNAVPGLRAAGVNRKQVHADLARRLEPLAVQFMGEVL